MSQSILRGAIWAVLLATVVGVTLSWWNARSASVAAGDLPVLAQLPSFELVERSGRRVALGDLAGAPWIADFIFTRCAATCPRMTSQMRRLGTLLPAGVRRVSISVDPDYDSPEVLRSYARSYALDGEDWWFLTGGREEIRSLVTQGFLLAVGDADATQAEPILHSERFVLVDGAGQVRGYYDAFDVGALESLAAAATALSGAVATPGGMS